MDKKESRRIMPVSYVTSGIVLLLVFFEALVIGGILEMKASTVARIAPWAYEPFLKIVGEHPDSSFVKERSSSTSGSDMSAMDVVAGFNAEALSVETNLLLHMEDAEPVEDVEPDSAIVPPDSGAEEDAEEAVPVG